MVRHPFVVWTMWIFIWEIVSLWKKNVKNNSVVDDKMPSHNGYHNGHASFTHFVVHPTVPFYWDLRCIISHMNVGSILYPSITTVEIVIVFIVFISIFICADQSTNFQFIMPGKRKIKIDVLIDYHLTFHYITRNTQCRLQCVCTAYWKSQNSLVKFMQTVFDATIVLDNGPKSVYFVYTQKLRNFRHFSINANTQCSLQIASKKLFFFVSVIFLF